MTGPVLETARLRLRPFAPYDVGALHAHWTDPDVRRYLWDGIVIPHEQVAAVVEASIASFATHGFGFWVLLEKDHGALVGFAAVRPIDEGSDVELLYGLEPARWHRGLATEAAREILRYGFEQVGLDRVFIRADGPNTASVEVMKRVRARYVRTDPTGAFGETIVYVVRRDG